MLDVTSNQIRFEGSDERIAEFSAWLSRRYALLTEDVVDGVYTAILQDAQPNDVAIRWMTYLELLDPRKRDYSDPIYDI